MAAYYISERYNESNTSSNLDIDDNAKYIGIEEDIRSYCHGGFHPVQIGELYGGKYSIVRKLGFGRESTVWLANDKRYVKVVNLALKF
jgi:serine/threonine-protein kinase SRPK3